MSDRNLAASRNTDEGTLNYAPSQPENGAVQAMADSVSEIPERRIGEFTLVREIGRGGMGVVYEAFQESLRRTVALKILPLAGRVDRRQIQRFQNESMAAAQLEHSNIVPVYSVGVDAGVHYYAMQLIVGRDLSQIIRSAKHIVEARVSRPSGETPAYMGTTIVSPSDAVANQIEETRHDIRLSVTGSTDSAQFSRLIESLAMRKSTAAAPIAFETTINIGIQAAEALQHAHDLGIVHRDIKPSNLLLDDHGKLWVADFGLAQVQGAAAVTMSGEVVGTLRFMSPEQPLGKRVLVDQRTDIYSLGITLYELLTLQKAFDGATPKEIIKQVCFDDPVPVRRLNPMVPPDLETILHKAISKNPADRYQTAGEFADDLRRFLNDQPIAARRPTLTQRSRRWIRRHMLFTTSMAVAITALMLTSVTASALILNSLNAETQQRKRAESLLERSEGLRLTANAARHMDANPGQAMLLALRGSELTAGVDSGTTLLQTLDRNHELRTFSPRNHVTDDFAVSPDGQRIVSTASISLQAHAGSLPAVVSDLASGESLLTLQSDRAVTSAAYSPNAEYLLTTSADVSRSDAGHDEPDPSALLPELWDATTGERKLTFSDAILPKAVQDCFSPASDRIVLTGIDHSVRIYSAIDGHLDNALLGHTARILSAAFSGDGKRLLSVSEDSTVRVWDARSGATLRVFSIDDTQPQSMIARFAGDANTVIVSADSGTRLLSVDSGEQLNSQHWHETSATVSSDGRLIALMYPYVEAVTIRSRYSGQIVSQFSTRSGITSASFSPDGSLLLATTFENAEIFRTDEGTQVATLNGHTEMVTQGVFTSDGNHVATISEDKTIRLWSVLSGGERRTFLPRLATLTPHPYAISDDSTLVSVATRQNFRGQLRDADGNVIAGEFMGLVDPPLCNTQRLVTLSGEDVFVWSLPTSRRIASIAFPGKMVRTAVAVPDSPMVVILIEGGPTYLWNADTNDKQLIVDPNISAFDCAPHPADGRIALSLQDGRCVLVDSGSGQILQNLPHDARVVTVTFSDDGNQLLTVDDRNAAHLWSGDGFARKVTMQEPGKQFNRAALSGDYTTIITWASYKNQPVCAWDAATGMKKAETPAIRNAHTVLHAEKSIATVASDDGLLLWEWGSAQLRTLTTMTSKSAVFLGDRLLSIEHIQELSPDETPAEHSTGASHVSAEFVPWVLNVRDVTSGEIVATQQVTGEPWRLSADPAVQQVVVTCVPHSVTVMDMKSRRQLSSVGNHAAPIVFQAFTHENRAIVCVSRDRTSSVWSLTGQRLHLLSGHQHEILTAAISPDRRQLATFDARGKGIQWDLRTGKQVRSFDGHTGVVQTAQFSASGRQLMTASSDKTVRLWDLVGRSESEFVFEPGVKYAVLSPDEKQILVIDGGNAAAGTNESGQNVSTAPSRVFLVETDSDVRREVTVDGPAAFASIRSDGRQFAVLTKSGSAFVYDMASAQKAAHLDLNRRQIRNLAFSPDSRQIIVLNSNELSLWDLESGAEQLRIPCHGTSPGPARGLGVLPDWKPFSPDGKWVMTDADRLKKWPRDPLLDAQQQAPRQLSPDEIRQFAVNLLNEE